MRCPYCASEDDKVVDSRLGEEGRAIRRRRECLGCGRRYTTFERAEEVPLLIRKSSGSEQPFDRDKVFNGIRMACKNRPVGESEIRSVVDDVEEAMRAKTVRPIASSDIGLAVLERLHNLDEVAYIRFASVYKDFQELGDFQHELRQLLKKPPTEGSGE
ncbi:MAG TPA: transcriptional regulator NrdR [Actinomycetota bacterium]|nr:transcriptional regulator NrdR [Actinomycetota bacterium]